MATIYGVFSPSEEVYIGCTKGKLSKRMREHRCLLRNKKHKSVKFQESWDFHGEEGFHVEPLEEVGDCKDEKRAREQHWMDYYAERGLLLNFNPIAATPPPGAQAKAAKKRVANGYRPSKEANRKRSEAMKGRAWVPKGQKRV